MRANGLEPNLQDDLVQEGLAALVAGVTTYRGEARFETWAWAVSRNAMIDYVRRVRRIRSQETLLPEQENGGDDFADPLCGLIDLLAALKAVPDASLLLHQLLGFEDKEISSTNLRMRRLRCRRRLRALIGGL
jgi:RNA polymerase sigma factor (sigma-70 family)